jgi:hypothetical protein
MFRLLEHYAKFIIISSCIRVSVLCVGIKGLSFLFSRCEPAALLSFSLLPLICQQLIHRHRSGVIAFWNPIISQLLLVMPLIPSSAINNVSSSRQNKSIIRNMQRNITQEKNENGIQINKIQRSDRPSPVKNQ